MFSFILFPQVLHTHVYTQLILLMFGGYEQAYSSLGKGMKVFINFPLKNIQICFWKFLSDPKPVDISFLCMGGASMAI